MDGTDFLCLLLFCFHLPFIIFIIHFGHYGLISTPTVTTFTCLCLFDCCGRCCFSVLLLSRVIPLSGASLFQGLPVVDPDLMKYIHVLLSNLRSLTLASSFLSFAFVFAVICFLFSLPCRHIQFPFFFITFFNWDHYLKSELDYLDDGSTVTYTKL